MTYSCYPANFIENEIKILASHEKVEIMGKLEWAFCHDDDWITYFAAWLLLWPYMVWAGFFFAGLILSSPVLLYVSKCSSIITFLFCWGLQELLQIPRPSHQECETTLALPDKRMVIGVVNVLTVMGIVVITRKGVHPFALLIVFGSMVLYFFAVNLNGYLSPIQFFFSLGLSLSFSGFWVATYVLLVRPILLYYGWKDVSMLGEERAPPFTPMVTPLDPERGKNDRP